MIMKNGNPLGSMRHKNSVLHKYFGARYIGRWLFKMIETDKMRYSWQSEQPACPVDDDDDGSGGDG